MELQQFEQAILKLAFETEARITTASVAYYLGVPSRDANRLLNELLEQGVLELDSDESGNLYYRVPNHPGEEGKFAALKDLRDEEHGTTAPPTQPPPRPRRPSPKHFAASAADGGDQQEAFRPSREAFRPTSNPASANGPRRTPPGPPPEPRSRESRDGATKNASPWGGFDDYYGGGTTAPSGLDGDSGRGVRADGGRSGVVRDRPRWGTVSTRVASPDGGVGSCGSSSMIVNTAVRCEPKPLPQSKPVITSCSESITTTPNSREHSWFGEPGESTALVPAGEMALSRDYIEQPEHQPGMALLLSLILCGTGQIYNGEISKGIMMMVLCFLLWFVLLGWVVHIWSIVDAVVVAERLNKKTSNG